MWHYMSVTSSEAIRTLYLNQHHQFIRIWTFHLEAALTSFNTQHLTILCRHISPLKGTRVLLRSFLCLCFMTIFWKVFILLCRVVTVSHATPCSVKFIYLKVHHYMFRPIWSWSGVKIFGEETAVFCCCLCYSLDARACSSWWVVFSLVVFCAACLVFECIWLPTRSVTPNRMFFGFLLDKFSATFHILRLIPLSTD
jgi:hypothetical protein